MDKFLLIVLTLVVAAYALWIIFASVGKARGNAGLRRKQRGAGGRYGQLGSVTGGARPSRVGPTVWFLLLVCAAILYVYWVKR